MKIPNEPCIVIYHSADFDGIFSREIARLHLGDSAEYIGWNYGDAVPEIPPGVRLYMIDISVEGLMDHPGLIWIDHHKTAMEKYPAKIPGYRIDGVAACRLAWQWFAGLDTDSLAYVQEAGWRSWVLPCKSDYVDRAVTEPLAVRLAGEYDIWDKGDPRADLFQHALRLPGVEIAALIANHEDDEPGEDERLVEGLLKRGEDIAHYVAERDKSHITKAGFDLKWEGLTFLACNASGYNSHLFTAGLKSHHDALLGFRWAGDKWLVSLYGAPGKPDFDLSMIAVRHGGGGHRQACGFECQALPFALGPVAIPEAFLVGQSNLINTLLSALDALGAPEDTKRALVASGDVEHVHWWISERAKGGA
ncbi:MAG: hypothetical protein H7067_07550 [Burkholderiales bacterium]|nr:hypothetical protein [Opitutaceae bacterium]